MWSVLSVDSRNHEQLHSVDCVYCVSCSEIHDAKGRALFNQMVVELAFVGAESPRRLPSIASTDP